MNVLRAEAQTRELHVLVMLSLLLVVKKILLNSCCSNQSIYTNPQIFYESAKITYHLQTYHVTCVIYVRL